MKSRSLSLGSSFAQLCRLVAALPLLGLCAQAQEVVRTAPIFAQTAVQSDRFDAVFDYTVPIWPMAPLFRNQPDDARFDMVICNLDPEHRGSVRASGSNTLAYLKPGECTMFAGIANAAFTRPDGEYEWTAKIYLRAHH